MANSKITVESLNLHYGENHALKNVNMEIADHAITAFIGSFEGGADEMLIAQKILKLLLMIAVAPIVVALTLFVWICLGLVYVSGLVLGLISMILALLGVAVLITYSPQNGLILLLMTFLISPMGIPLAAIWLLGKVQDFH